MKPLTKTVFVLLMTVVIASISVLAQDSKRPGIRSRGIEMEEDYNNGRADMMRVAIHKEVENRLVPVLATEAFKSGDRIRLEFESNFSGFVYIINVAPNGKTCLLFPHPSERNNAVNARQRYSLPQSRMLRFNDDKGVEVLQVYMSRQPIPLFDDALKNAIEQDTKACLGDSVVNAARELADSAYKNTSKPPQRGIETNVSSPVLAQGGRASIRSRGVYYDSGEDSSKKESTIAVEKKDGQTHLKDGDVAFYEIHLQHN
ncbi:MAG TPA: DUF4384 domain-containing protein [Blastocatellia bacterium]|jgi:hypothetical protein